MHIHHAAPLLSDGDPFNLKFFFRDHTGLTTGLAALHLLADLPTFNSGIALFISVTEKLTFSCAKCFCSSVTQRCKTCLAW